jgi:tetratricopeptide (TPR) repeat protein
MTKIKFMAALSLVTVLIASSYIIAARRAGNLFTTDLAGLMAEISFSPSGLNQPEVDTVIAFWQKRISQNPQAYLDYTYLGQAYNQKARETGDIAYYQRAEAALRRALAINPRYSPSSAQLAGVLFALHDFEGALALAEPLANEPRAFQALATLGDAHLALGHYAAAEQAYQKLFERNAGPAAYSRVAILAFWQGDSAKALALMQQAAELARQSEDFGESLAWYDYQVGELYFKAGQLEAAEKQYQQALRQFEGYYLALAGLAKVRAAHGDYEAAIEHYQQAINQLPQPEFLAALGDIFSLTNRPEQAQLQYDTVEVIGRLAEINQQLYNRQLANYYANQGLHPAKALHLARLELAYRQDIDGYDTAAWAYYRNGRLAEAQAMIEQALQFGTREARLYYHAGMIAWAQGRAEEAEQLLGEALTINPHFDLLQAHFAQKTLEQLRAGKH